MIADNSIWKLLKDLEIKKGITEVIINGAESVYIERAGELIQLSTDLNTEDFIPFCQSVAKFNECRFGMNDPIIDGTLPDGSRINVISPIYTQKTPAITIRKYLTSIASFDALEGKFGLTDKWLKFFKALVHSKMNIIVSGGTNMGKTTFLNLLLAEVSLKERIITIEDTKELRCSHPNLVSLITARNRSGVTEPLAIRDLVKNALRMRPDRIIIGETRGKEAFDMLQAMNTGHDGSMCTIHANNPVEALSRLESLFTFAGLDIPIPVIRNQISHAVDFVIQLGKSRNGERIVSHVYEVTGMEGEVIVTQSIGEMTDNGPAFTGLVPKNITKLIDQGLQTDFFIV